MNIREVVEALTRKAGELPGGWDAEVRVAMCDGAGSEITTEIEVDHMSEVTTEGSPINHWAIVQGHPHRDEQAQRLRGVTEGADDALRRWSDPGQS